MTRDAKVRRHLGALLLCATILLGRATAQDGIDGMQPIGTHAEEGFRALGVELVGSYAYVVAGEDPGLRTFDLSDPARPGRIDARGLPSFRAYADAGLLFSFCHTAGLQVFDITSAVPQLLGAFDPGDARLSYEGGVRVGERLYVAAHQHGLQVLAVGDPASPAWLSDIVLPDSDCWDLVHRDGYLFVANGRFGMSVVDVGARSEIASFTLPGLACDIELSEDGMTCFVALAAGGIAVMGVGDPRNPHLREIRSTRGSVYALGRAGDLLASCGYPYVTRYNAGDPSEVRESGWELLEAFASAVDVAVSAGGDTLVVVAGMAGLTVYNTREDARGDIAVHPLWLDLGASGAPRDSVIRIGNAGAGTLTVHRIEVPDLVSVEPAAFVLDPGQRQDLNISVTGSGRVHGAIRYHSDDPDEPVVEQRVYKNGGSYLQNESLAPDFALRGSDGELHRLSDRIRKVVVLEFVDPHHPSGPLQTAVTQACIRQRYGTNDIEVLQIAERLSSLEDVQAIHGVQVTGLEDPGDVTYATYRSPDPLDTHPQITIVDQAGSIRYTSTVYDPAEMIDAIDWLLTCDCIADDPNWQPERFYLSPPRPSVVRSDTDIWFQLPQPGHVQIRVLDAAGRRIRTLKNGPAGVGSERVKWNGRDTAGVRVASGVYFVTLRAEGARASQRVVLVN